MRAKELQVFSPEKVLSRLHLHCLPWMAERKPLLKILKKKKKKVQKINKILKIIKKEKKKVLSTS